MTLLMPRHCSRTGGAAAEKARARPGNGGWNTTQSYLVNRLYYYSTERKQLAHKPLYILQITNTLAMTQTQFNFTLNQAKFASILRERFLIIEPCSKLGSDVIVFIITVHLYRF